MYKIAIPYRNREFQLSLILSFYQYSLSGLDYEIIIIEQDNDRIFSSAKLINSAFDLFDFKDDDTFILIGTETLIEYPPLLLCNRGEIKFFGVGGRSHSYENNAYVGIFSLGLGMHSYDSFSCDPKIYEMLGGLDQRYEGWGNEDADFVKRTVNAYKEGKIKGDCIKFEHLTGLQLGDTQSMTERRNKEDNKNRLNYNIPNTYNVTLNNKITNNISHIKIDWVNFK